MRAPGTVDLWMPDHSSHSLALETVLAVMVSEGKITITGDNAARRINKSAQGLRDERAERDAAEKPYAFWLGRESNPLDGARLWKNS